MHEMITSDANGIPTISPQARHIAAWILLGVMVLVVYSLYSQFTVRNAQWAAETGGRTSLIATPAVDPYKQKPKPPPEKGPWVVTLTAVNFRTEPSASSDEIRTFKEGEKVKLLSTVGAWHKVRDGKGKEGWVTASDKYTKVVKK